MNRLLVGALLTALLSACASTPMPDSASVAAKGSTGATPSAGIAPGQADGPVLPAHRDPKNRLSQQRSVYFDLDESAIKRAFHSTLQAHADYLVAKRDQKIVIEGNTDEQGSREYNLALGQKRADAVRKALSLLGVPDVRMEAISWGEERPRVQGHNAAAWAENRRADIRYGDEK